MYEKETYVEASGNAKDFEEEAESSADEKSDNGNKREDRLDDIDEKIENGAASAMVITYLIHRERMDLTVSSRYANTERLLEIIDVIEFESERLLAEGFSDFEFIQALVYSAINRHEKLVKTDESYASRTTLAMEVFSNYFESKQRQNEDGNENKTYVATKRSEYDPNIR